MLDDIRDLFEIHNSSFEIIQRNQGQLNHPSKRTEECELYYGAISKEYESIDDLFWEKNSRIKQRIMYLKIRIKNSIPIYLKRIIKQRKYSSSQK